MPTYEFICDKCGKTRDKFFHMLKVPEFIKCECDGKKRMKRQIGSGSGFMFKGPPWNE